MVLHRKRRLFLGLGLTVALGLVVVLPSTAAAATTLTGENFASSAGQGDPGGCARATTFSASGAASGPYVGTFTETGSFNGAPSVSATFSITSGTAPVTGSKSGPPLAGGSFGCGSNGAASAFVPQERYSATIHTANANFHDEGVTRVIASITASGAVALTESFTSSLSQPVLIVPTTKAQCKKGGWRDYPQFKNQGMCVRFVVTGKPPPGAQRMSGPGQSKTPGPGNKSKAPK